MASILSNSFLLLSDLFLMLNHYSKTLSQLGFAYHHPQCEYVCKVFHSKHLDLWELSLLGYLLVRLADIPLVHCEVEPIHYYGPLPNDKHTTCPLQGRPICHLVNIPLVHCEVEPIYWLHSSIFHNTTTRQTITYMEHLHIVLPSIYH